MLLEPAVLARLERLALVTNKRLPGSMSGEHRSNRLGSSVDFADWRAYQPGDDFRRIDYQIYARLDRLLVRMYEAEDELSLRVVIDASRSMSFGSKLDAAKRLAGALLYLAACRRDRAQVWVVDGNGVRASPWCRSKPAASSVFSWIEEVEAEGTVSLHAALRRIAASGGLPGMTVVLSDLLTEDWEAAVGALAGPRAEASVLHMLSRAERDPPERGDLHLVDSESESSLDVSLSETVIRRYRERVDDWLGKVKEACRRREIHYRLVDPQDPLESVLLRQLRPEGVIA